MAIVYISGPMTGLPELNYPAFNSAEMALRDIGIHAENPAKNPKPSPETWENYMRMAIRQLCTCDLVVTLDGWCSSRGAVAEVELAHRLGMRVVPYHEYLQEVLQ